MQNSDPRRNAPSDAAFGSKHQETIDEVVGEALRGTVPRRDFLRRAVLLGLTSSAAYKLLDATSAQAQTTQSQNGGLTTFAIGEEGTPPPASSAPAPNPPSYNPNPSATTLAVGEESKPRSTTAVVGEEDAGRPPTLSVGEENTRPPTTYSTGEEQPYCPTPKPTTKAVGEEGKAKINPSTRRYGEESGGGARPTTFADGEEGTPRPQPVSYTHLTLPTIQLKCITRLWTDE